MYQATAEQETGGKKCWTLGPLKWFTDLSSSIFPRIIITAPGKLHVYILSLKYQFSLQKPVAILVIQPGCTFHLSQVQ